MFLVMVPQLQSIATDESARFSIGAGSSEGVIYMWDLRNSQQATYRWAAHGSDVCGLQFCNNSHFGDLLSCSSDGTVQAWHLDYSQATSTGSNGVCSDIPEEKQGRTLVKLELPINDLHYSKELGYLASASDSEVLTFIDMDQRSAQVGHAS